MYRKIYSVILLVLLLLSVTLIALKSEKSKESEIVETNYIGDMEYENQEETEDIIEEEEAEILEIGSTIRVLIKDNDFINLTHEVVTISSESGLLLSYDGQEEIIEGGEEISIDVNDGRFQDNIILITTVEESDKIIITSLERGYEDPEYYGSIEVYQEDEGLVIVNEVELEYYLRGVLPSEMPASFELEALKAQAVCARSYAYKHMAQYNYPDYNAHIDDSTSYQVYNNLEESEICNQAIEETWGEKIVYQGEVATAYFFSTSSGMTTTVEAWGGTISDKTEYLQSVAVTDGEGDFESELPWYQWSITLTQSMLKEILEENLDMELGDIVSMQVTERAEGDVAVALEIVGETETIIIENEYDIRKCLGSSQYTIIQNGGNERSGMSLLPSAFFEIEYSDGNYILEGGGFGHGIGMSQYGANEMAKEGYDYIEILKFFYTGIDIL